jgi:hypothetical protein
MRLLAAPLAVCAVACAQIAVDESATHARLVDGATSVSLAFRNGFSQCVAVRVTLEWALPQDSHNAYRSRAETRYVVPSGKSSVPVPLPLNPKDDALLYRLRYRVISDADSLTAFSPLAGVLSFPNITEHAFVLTAVGIGNQARLGTPYEFRVFAAHPVTHRPVPGVMVSIDRVSAKTDAGGAAVLHVTSDRQDLEDFDDVTIEGRLGDFVYTTETRRPALPPNFVRIYTDKPLYQPGQTAHVRILAIGRDGRARSGAEYSIEIRDEHSTLVQSVDLTTSRFGIAHTEWEIPPNATAGQYQIHVEDADDSGPSPRPHVIEVRRYELPSFRVTVKPDRPYYLPGQEPTVEVRADYLFGKPIAGGKVRISEGDEEAALHQGVTDNAGRFRTTIGLKEVLEQLGDSRFLDLHYTAYVTDPTTNRTEQRRFDLRFSKDPVHLYIIRSEATEVGTRLYAGAYTPDGEPAIAPVEALSQGHPVATSRTNRFGVARLDLPPGQSALMIRARVPAGTAEEEWNPQPDSCRRIRLDTDHSLYGPGQPIRCRIASGEPHVKGTLLAWREDGRVLFSRAVEVQNGKAAVEIPPAAEPAGKITVAFLSALGPEYETSHTVLYPGSQELRLTAKPSRITYRPGDRASLAFQATDIAGKPVEAALGVAVVDQGVFERVATDQVGRRRRWFLDDYNQEARVGGFSLQDLLDLPPDQIDEGHQLVAEALLGTEAVFFPGLNFLREQTVAYSGLVSAGLAQVVHRLDEEYRRTFRYPRDEEALIRMAGPEYESARDPWLQPYHARFLTGGPHYVTEFLSSGPDKKFGTADDMVAATVERNWLFPVSSQIDQILERPPDYPATPEDFVRLLDGGGIRFDALRDPWGSPLRVAISHRYGKRIIEIRSDGPDRTAGTGDDFTVQVYQGTFFRTMEADIEKALASAQEFPADEEQFRTVLTAAGIDLDHLRDPWGRRYHFKFGTDSKFSDHYRVYTIQPYQGIPQERTDVVPVKLTSRDIEIRSDGEDGVRNTYDDFTIARFGRVIDESHGPEKPSPTGQPPSATISGRGTITGNITDPSGAAVPKAEVILGDLYRTQADEAGRYYFHGVPPGMYKVRFQSPGFQITVIEAVPVRQGHITRVDALLRIGAVDESVTVAAELPMLQTSASLAYLQPGVAATYTPRVRDYFPETLLWNPELVTNAEGQASAKFKLADSITTWHVAVIGSTIDGRIAETSTEIKAFQPFFVDLDPPQVLTTGDEIALPVPVRNYLDAAQRVAVEVSRPPALQLVQPPKPALSIAASSSANSVLQLRAAASAGAARLRVTARGADFGDAIEKPVSIHLDGEPVSRSVSDLIENGHSLRIDIPADAIQGSVQGQVVIYPSLLAQIIESMEALLEKPHGCGEQTISSTYPNLLFLRALKDSGFQGGRVEERARLYLRSGYQRLLGYRTPEGGFAYWSHQEADVALTAYAISFLEDAKEIMDVDPDVIQQAYRWLAQQKSSDFAIRSVALRALANAGREYEPDVLARLGELARTAASMDEPYAIATFALAALDAGKPELARTAIERLRSLAREDRGMVYWHSLRNTPYYGWGRAGMIETTALAVSALDRWRKQGAADPALDSLIRRGALFLLRNKDDLGTWLSTQATIRVCQALLSALAAPGSSPTQSAEILVNGRGAGTVRAPAGPAVPSPITVDVARFLQPGIANEVSIRVPAGWAVAQARFTASWYEPWKSARNSEHLALDVSYSAKQTFPNEPVRCNVRVSRPTFRGYGMVIAEIGLPPGAEVDRGTLSDLVDHGKSGVDSFEVAPDHVTFYIWPSANDSTFSFTFRPRYPMHARTAPSVLYDYYNPDARVVSPPATLAVEDK